MFLSRSQIAKKHPFSGNGSFSVLFLQNKIRYRIAKEFSRKSSWRHTVISRWVVSKCKRKNLKGLRGLKMTKKSTNCCKSINLWTQKLKPKGIFPHPKNRAKTELLLIYSMWIIRCWICHKMSHLCNRLVWRIKTISNYSNGHSKRKLNSKILSLFHTTCLWKIQTNSTKLDN